MQELTQKERQLLLNVINEKLENVGEVIYRASMRGDKRNIEHAEEIEKELKELKQKIFKFN